MVCGPGMFCPSGIPSFLVGGGSEGWRAQGQVRRWCRRGCATTCGPRVARRENHAWPAGLSLRATQPCRVASGQSVLRCFWSFIFKGFDVLRV